MLLRRVIEIGKTGPLMIYSHDQAQKKSQEKRVDLLAPMHCMITRNLLVVELKAVFAALIITYHQRSFSLAINSGM